MSAGDWIKLHRCVMESPVWDDPWDFRLFMWCLLKASFCDRRIGGIDIKRGQFVTGRHVAVDELRVDGSRWYRGMQRLEKAGCICIESNSRFTVVTVCNYDTYQSSGIADRTTIEQQTNNDRTTIEQRSNTEEERNNSTKNLSHGGDASAMDHERMFVEQVQGNPETNPAHRGWEPVNGMSQVTIDAVRRWQEFHFAVFGRALPFQTIEAELRARRSEGWTPDKFSRGVDLTIRVKAQRLLDPDKDYQKSERPKSSSPPMRSANPQLKVS